MRNFIRTLAVCIAVISTSIPIMAQQISIVSGKVLNLPEGEKKPRPFHTLPASRSGSPISRTDGMMKSASAIS